MSARPNRPNSHIEDHTSPEAKEIPSPSLRELEQDVLRLAAGAEPEDQPGYRLRRAEARRTLVLLVLAAFIPLPSYVCRGPDISVPPSPRCAESSVCDSLRGLDALWWGTKLNLNTVTVDQLQVVDGVGPRLAARIIAHRDEHGAFDEFDDVQNVRGVGPKLAGRIAEFVEVRKAD